MNNIFKSLSRAFKISSFFFFLNNVRDIFICVTRCQYWSSFSMKMHNENIKFILFHFFFLFLSFNAIGTSRNDGTCLHASVCIIFEFSIAWAFHSMCTAKYKSKFKYKSENAHCNSQSESGNWDPNLNVWILKTLCANDVRFAKHSQHQIMYVRVVLDLLIRANLLMHGTAQHQFECTSEYAHSYFCITYSWQKGREKEKRFERYNHFSTSYPFTGAAAALVKTEHCIHCTVSHHYDCLPFQFSYLKTFSPSMEDSELKKFQFIIFMFWMESNGCE